MTTEDAESAEWGKGFSRRHGEHGEVFGFQEGVEREVEVRGAREGAEARRGEALFLTETRRHGGGQGSDFSFQGSGEALRAEDGERMTDDGGRKS